MGKYQKNDDETFNILMNRGNPKLASRYARRFVEMSHYIRQNRQLLPYDELKALELKHYQLSDKVQNIEENMLTRAVLCMVF